MSTDFDDDAPIGRVLTRREAIVTLGGAGAAGLLMLTGCTRPAVAASGDTATSSTGCVAKPEMTEGPYFVDEKLNRSDVRIDTSNGKTSPGSQLALKFNVSRIQSNACTALPGAQVDIWHCDALGVYSDARDPSFDTRGKNFLRGFQVTDANATAAFTTIIPGWYQGRASHIHFKVRGKSSSGANYDFTSQLFFTEAFLTSLYTSASPYATKGDAGRTLNARDRIYNQGGSQLLVTPAASSAGYTASLNIGLSV